jgi:FAD/FMN-containing dehydrogenase
MTTPTTAEVGHRRKEPTVVEIDGFRGRLIRADHPDYDTARAVWNGVINRRPRLIAQCIGTADVVAAVRFARDHDLEIAIRGGGHNVAGTAVCDGGIVSHTGVAGLTLGGGVG